MFTASFQKHLIEINFFNRRKIYKLKTIKITDNIFQTFWFSDTLTFIVSFEHSLFLLSLGHPEWATTGGQKAPFKERGEMNINKGRIKMVLNKRTISKCARKPTKQSCPINNEYECNKVKIKNCSE